MRDSKARWLVTRWIYKRGDGEPVTEVWEGRLAQLFIEKGGAILFAVQIDALDYLECKKHA